MDWAELMSRGRFEEAWRICDRNVATRPADISTQPRHVQTLWNGTPIVGRRVLIHCYHGLGDTLQFIRYVPAVQRLAREVSVWVQPELIELLTCAGITAPLLPLHEGTPDVERDLDIEIMELPHVFRTTVASIPVSTPYLFLPAQPSRGAIGLTWRAGGWDSERSVPLRSVVELVSTPGVRFIPLHEPLSPAERVLFERNLPACSSILSLAQVIMSCRLVITVDTMSAHLAGALNVPTWTLLKHECDWRWMLDRSDTPWYPSMRLYRQPLAGAWDEVIARVRRDLRSEISPADADRLQPDRQATQAAW